MRQRGGDVRESGGRQEHVVRKYTFESKRGEVHDLTKDVTVLIGKSCARLKPSVRSRYRCRFHRPYDFDRTAVGAVVASRGGSRHLPHPLAARSRCYSSASRAPPRALPAVARTALGAARTRSVRSSVPPRDVSLGVGRRSPARWATGREGPRRRGARSTRTGSARACSRGAPRTRRADAPARAARRRSRSSPPRSSSSSSSRRWRARRTLSPARRSRSRRPPSARPLPAFTPPRPMMRLRPTTRLHLDPSSSTRVARLGARRARATAEPPRTRSRPPASTTRTSGNGTLKR